MLNELAAMGVEHFDFAMNRTGINPFDDFKLLLALNRQIRKIQPDVVFGYTIKPVIYGSLAAKFNRVDTIVSMVTGIGYVFTNRRLKARVLAVLCRMLYWIGLNACHTILFQNKDDIELFTGKKILGKDQDVRIVNGSGVDLQHYQFRDPSENIIFLLIGRLLYSKGIVEFIGAAKKLKEKYPETAFALVGNADPNPDCIPADVINQSVADGIIEYHGYLEDVRPVIANSSVYVLPSYREGTPRTVLEAMSMGRAIITTNTAGCKETIKLTDTNGVRKEDGLIEGANGYLCPVADAAALAAAMEKFVMNPSLVKTMGLASLDYAHEKYDVDKVNNQIMSALKAL
jgi:glycosyltransferase involved in cell wall biosynthesis